MLHRRSILGLPLPGFLVLVGSTGDIIGIEVKNEAYPNYVGIDSGVDGQAEESVLESERRPFAGLLNVSELTSIRLQFEYHSLRHLAKIHYKFCDNLGITVPSLKDAISTWQLWLCLYWRHLSLFKAKGYR